MQKQITTTTAQNGLGIAPGQKLMKVPSGFYAGRMAALVQTAAGEFKLYYADAPYTNWSTPITVASDAVDDAFTAAMDSSGNIHVVYTETSSEYLVTKKLSFTSGVWQVGSKVTIFNGNPSYFPSLAIEPGGKIWVSYTRINGALYYIYVKSSVDGGAVWGSGSADAGDSISSGHTSAYSKIVIGPNDLFIIYTGNGSDLYFSSRNITGGSWSSPFNVATGGTFDEHFDSNVSTEGLLGVVFENGQLRYREYNAGNWGATVNLDSNAATFPQLKFSGNVPVVVYLQQFASGQIIMKHTDRQSGSFSTPTVLDRRASQFDNVTLYESISTSYADLTAEAASSSSADLFHPSSGVLMKAVGDAMYLGMQKKFRFLRSILSTAGAGGTVNYSYWDGTGWKAFTPGGGNFNFDAADEELTLWTDYESVAQDWQQNSVNGYVRFWIRIAVDSAFSTGPVGSQITALSNILALCIRR